MVKKKFGYWYEVNVYECGKCSFQLDEGWEYCPNCGESVE